MEYFITLLASRLHPRPVDKKEDGGALVLAGVTINVDIHGFLEDVPRNSSTLTQSESQALSSVLAMDLAGNFFPRRDETVLAIYENDSENSRDMYSGTCLEEEGFW